MKEMSLFDDVVHIISTIGGKETYGSGLLIAPRLVLTAAHVLPKLGDKCTVQLLRDKNDSNCPRKNVNRYEATVLWKEDNHTSVALLRLNSTAPNPCLEVHLASFSGEWDSLKLVAIGFPDATVKDDKPIEYKVAGTLRAIQKNGYLAWRVDIQDAPRHFADWGGMSGAAVCFIKGSYCYILGVVQEVPKKFGDGTLYVSLVADAYSKQGFQYYLREVMGHAAELVRLPRRIHSSSNYFSRLENGCSIPAVSRYLTLKSKGWIGYDTSIAQQFSTVLKSKNVIMLEGVSGSGKTIAACGFTSFYKTDEWGPWEVWICSLRDIDNAMDLSEEIKARCCPSIFIVDDAHLQFDNVYRLMLSMEGDDDTSIPYKLVLTAQLPPEEQEPLSVNDTYYIVDEYRKKGLSIRLEPTLEQYGKIIATRGSEWADTSPRFIELLYEVTAADLMILTTLLEAINHQDMQTDNFCLEDLFKLVRLRYFHRDYVCNSELKALAAICQFNVALPRRYFNYDINKIPTELVFCTGRPASFTFSHASLAELIFRALAHANGDQDIASVAAKAICSFFCQWKDDSTFIEQLYVFLRNYTKLSDDTTIKIAVLSDQAIRNRLGSLRHILSLQYLGVIVWITKSHCKDNLYAHWLAEKLAATFCQKHKLVIEDYVFLGMGLRSLQFSSTKLHAALFQPPKSFPGLLQVLKNGGYTDFMAILRYIPEAIACKALTSCDESDLSSLVEKSIQNNQPVGTLNCSLKTLGTRRMEMPDGRSQLEAVEALMGAKNMLRLLTANGDFISFCRVLERSSPGFSGQMLDSLDANSVLRLVERSTARAQSTGTLNLILRELGKRRMETSDDRSQLQVLETLVGAENMAKLIIQNGDFISFCKTLAYSSPGFSGQMLDSLDANSVSRLVERSTARAQSIGALNLILRELRKRRMETSDDRSQLQVLETLVGAENMAKLIIQNGDFAAFFRLKRILSYSFFVSVFGQFDKQRVMNFISKTISREKYNAQLYHHLHFLLSKTIGVDLLQGLITETGDLLAINCLLLKVSQQERDILFGNCSWPKLGQWDAMARRGGLPCFVTFIHEGLAKLPKQARNNIIPILKSVIFDIVGHSSWKNLYYCLINATENNEFDELTKALMEAIQERLKRVKIHDLAFDNLTEAANCVNCLWKYREADRAELGQRIWYMLPRQESWKIDEFFISGRFLLAIARSQQVPQEIAKNIFHIFSSVLQNSSISNISTHHMHLFLWNFFSLWHERFRDAFLVFHAIMQENFREVLLVYTEKHMNDARKCGDKVKLNALALGAVTACVAPLAVERIIAAVKQYKNTQYLSNIAQNEPFVLASLALLGLSLVDVTVMTPEKERVLYLKSKKYGDGGECALRCMNALRSMLDKIHSLVIHTQEDI